jgi:hypothetical protein
MSREPSSPHIGRCAELSGVAPQARLMRSRRTSTGPAGENQISRLSFRPSQLSVVAACSLLACAKAIVSHTSRSREGTALNFQCIGVLPRSWLLSAGSKATHRLLSGLLARAFRFLGTVWSPKRLPSLWIALMVNSILSSERWWVISHRSRSSAPGIVVTAHVPACAA